MKLMATIATGLLTLVGPGATQALRQLGQAVPGRTFTFCHTGGGTNCVVDSDTLWLDGVKIRISDIDTPETHQPKCPAQLELGKRATQRMIALVNVGPFELTDPRYARCRSQWPEAARAGEERALFW